MTQAAAPISPLAPLPEDCLAPKGGLGLGHDGKNKAQQKQGYAKPFSITKGPPYEICYIDRWEDEGGTYAD